MDQIDAEIIKILCKDARTPFKEIARLLGVGTDTIFRRFKKLEQEGKVSGASVVLSSDAIGIIGWCGLFVRVKQGSSPLIIKDKLSKISQLYGFVQLIGEYDFYLEVGFRDFKELYAFVVTLRKFKEIVAIDPMVHASHDWPLPTLPTLEPEFLHWLLDINKTH